MDLAQAIADAWRDGLLVAADRHGILPKELYPLGIKRPDLKASNLGMVPLQRLDRSQGRAPVMTQDQAKAAVHRARRVGVKTAAAELGISSSSSSYIYNVWRRLDIPLPGPPRRFIPHPGKRRLTRKQAEAAAARAREVGRDRVAAELGVSRTALGNCWRLYGIQGPGKAHAAGSASSVARPPSDGGQGNAGAAAGAARGHERRP